MRLELTPHHLLTAYAYGAFPMGDDEGTLHWLSPDPRAVIKLDACRPARSLRAVIRRGVFQIKVDHAFDQVIQACTDHPEGTWITPEIIEAYTTLHHLGFAHSVEAWQADRLVGGLYGIALGGAFFGESMFYRVSDASKVALITLVERLRTRGFVLLDVQFMTEHLHRFGAVEIRRQTYLRRLRHALELERSFVEPETETEPAAEESDQ